MYFDNVTKARQGAEESAGRRGQGKARPAVISPHFAGGNVTDRREAGAYGVFPLFQKSKQGRGGE